MARYQLLLPKMGESVAEATIIKWLKKPGDYIEADDAVMEIATDKVDSEVPSPVTGRLAEQLCKVDEVVQVGSVIAIIETDVSQTAFQAPQPVVSAPAAPAKPEVTSSQPVFSQQQVTPIQPITPPQPVVPPQTVVQSQPVVAQQIAAQPTVSNNGIHAQQSDPVIPGVDQLTTRPSAPQHENAPRFYSPLVKHIAVQENISASELDQIPGSGAEGRLTKDDLIAYIQAKHSKKEVPAIVEQPKAEVVMPVVVESAPEKVEQPPIAESMLQAKPAEQQPPVQKIVAEQTPSQHIKEEQPAVHQTVEAPKVAANPASETKITSSMSGVDEVIEMDRMRRLIADHMVMSKHTSAHVTSFVEADVTALVIWREKIKKDFEKREGEKITFTPIFIEAVVKAIKDMPMINVTVSGTQIIKKGAVNISMATALPNGNLIVPVIKKADELNLLGLTKAVNDLANRARIGKLQPDDVREGTFTITNVGTFGNVMGTPIINQPQVAILAVGAIKKKPAVIETPEGDVIAIRHMMFLSLSYDHRVVDGALGGAFVRRVADYLEKWDSARAI